MAFFTRVLAFSHVVPPRRSSGGPGAAGVLLDEVEARHGDEELVVARVPQLEELERLVRPDGHLLQADEFPDAVVDVDDEVAHLQVAQVGQERPRGRPARALTGPALFLEEIRLGVDPQARGGQPEPPRQHPRRHEHAGGERVLAAIDVHAAQLVVVENLDDALGAAGRGRDEEHRVAGAAGRRDLGDPVREPAREREGRLGDRG